MITYFKNRLNQLVSFRWALAFSVLASLVLLSCNDDDDAPAPDKNIVQLAQANPELSTLVTALTRFPDLVTTLSGSGQLTVFAPTNTAFTNLLTTLGLPSLEAIPDATLKSVLQYHVITSGALNASQLTNGTITTASGQTIAVNVTSGVTLNGSTKVTTADVQATNGVVHVVDAVLVPSNFVAPPNKTIVQLAQATPNLSVLVTALTKYPDLVSTLSGNGTFTVFAPTNTAFTNLLAAIGQTSLDDIPESVLKSVLQYHVVSTAALQASQLTAGNLNSVSNEAIAVTVTGGVRINGTVNVTTADVSATNGVVHIVDAVLVPPSIRPVVGTIVAPAYFNKNFSTLVAAVVKADLLSTLLGAGPFTLFAPTNAAFTAAGVTSLDNLTKAQLIPILQYHVLGSKVLAADLPSGSAAITTLNGKFYLSNGGSGVFINGTTQVTSTNINASNGVVHVINRTLIPPAKTIAQTATDLSTSSSPQFTQLVAALARTSGTGTDLLAAVSNADANLTVFAPTDAAFQALYTALGVANVNEIPIATLTAVLQVHVVGARVFSTDLTNGSVATLNGNVTVNATAKTITDAKGNVANLSANAALLNVLATNGVIHTIDKVLLPQ
jgi:transforming growth factor-beta-induced protein